MFQITIARCHLKIGIGRETNQYQNTIAAKCMQIHQNHSVGLIACPNGFEYETIKSEIYPSNEFNLVCDREYLFRLSLTLPYVGVMIGGMILVII
uniref:Uncharacterized protein n=1 Tax=Strigamia maritima TaxID=126957 RepID=T1IYP1_STRMM